MTRKAIIIGSPLTKGQKGYLSGVQRDVENYRDFLTSCEGGGWYGDEIVELKNRTWSEIEAHLQAITSETDICYVIFSGHGSSNLKDGKTYLKLNESEIKAHDSLNTKAKIQVTIIDACRDYLYPYPDSHMDEVDAIKLCHEKEQTFYYRGEYERIISQIINNFSNPNKTHKILIFSCGKGSSSIDLGNAYGGKFTYKFLDSAKKLAHLQNNQVSYYSINDVFDCTEINMINNPEQTEEGEIPQIPEREIPEEIKHLPFSLNYETLKNLFLIP